MKKLTSLIVCLTCVSLSPADVQARGEFEKSAGLPAELTNLTTISATQQGSSLYLSFEARGVPNVDTYPLQLRIVPVEGSGLATLNVTGSEATRSEGPIPIGRVERAALWSWIDRQNSLTKSRATYGPEDGRSVVLLRTQSDEWKLSRIVSWDSLRSAVESGEEIKDNGETFRVLGRIIDLAQPFTHEAIGVPGDNRDIFSIGPVYEGRTVMFDRYSDERKGEFYELRVGKLAVELTRAERDQLQAQIRGGRELMRVGVEGLRNPHDVEVGKRLRHVEVGDPIERLDRIQRIARVAAAVRHNATGRSRTGR